MTSKKALIGYTSEDHSDMPLLKKAEALMNKAAMEVNRARQDQKSAQDLRFALFVGIVLLF